MDKEHVVFDLPRGFDEIEDPVPMPEDWYPARIYGSPKLGHNNKLTEVMASGIEEEEALSADDKCSRQLIIPVETESPDTEYCRKMSVKLPYPSKYDLDRYDAVGQRVYDAKLVRIRDFLEACGGDVSGSQMVFEVGMGLQIYVQQLKVGNPGEERIINTVKIFGTGTERVFKPLGE